LSLNQKEKFKKFWELSIKSGILQNKNYAKAFYFQETLSGKYGCLKLPFKISKYEGGFRQKYC
jgi:hypothetical protein